VEQDSLGEYDAAVRDSWIAKELKLVQNVLPAVAKYGDDIGTLLAGVDMWMRTLKIGRRSPMKHHPDNESIERADLYKPIAYPKPDGVISFDRLTGRVLASPITRKTSPAICNWLIPKVPVEINLKRLWRARSPLLPGWRLRIRRTGRGRTAPADQRAELRPLQDLRHQGPDQNITGLRPKAAAGRTIRICEYSSPGRGGGPAQLVEGHRP
jgi:hypothetical protein